MASLRLSYATHIPTFMIDLRDTRDLCLGYDDGEGQNEPSICMKDLHDIDPFFYMPTAHVPMRSARAVSPRKCMIRKGTESEHPVLYGNAESRRPQRTNWTVSELVFCDVMRAYEHADA